ncbi:AbrB/MazE/SpoVT family DNA-binding domain-containing protein [Propionimicrobium sp. PCR01-08-3]|uniref:AbrB/MazE/SpoVT family DNA-binding domain-containing protein n=1 Tax=Propionimicrobium sp. PCR01-08-3 TaxID=3052086 RepID=UPI00255C58D4|nr:AbrB/MazE/SpoVT family DNA-binding domain-containing protein [Propionimicrobium sp. PCR01-08-3]WIY82732.1 AbrB/MazE/SpoVT family DNA-binding domain-containing protein [Propionimicrobium sp. PCR01-08-3]
MKLNSKGQVTIPASLRHQYGFFEGDEVQVIADGSTLRIVRTAPELGRGDRLIEQMRGRATTKLSTDELMALLRDE